MYHGDFVHAMDGKGNAGGPGLSGRARRRLHVRLRSGFGFRARAPARGSGDAAGPRGAGGGCCWGAAAAGALQRVPPRGGCPGPSRPPRTRRAAFASALCWDERGDPWQRPALPPPCPVTVTPAQHRAGQELGPGTAEAETPAPT